MDIFVSPNMGWECPRCHSILSPLQSFCLFCEPSKPARVNQIAGYCTCGSTGGCSLHPVVNPTLTISAHGGKET